ncbi:MAG: Ldh family oxidoreductase [Anaerolineae bacterium]|nr:Ldh family oxidoreductase [Anaerolineae bacterium]
MPTIPAPQLIEIGCAIFSAAGAPDDIARVVASSLVNANLSGHDSHGILKVPVYIDKIRAATLKPDARPTVTRRMGAVAHVDCGWGFGQPAARFGAQTAGEIAREQGIGCVALQRVNHIGRLSEYAQMLAEQELIGCVMTSGSMFGGSVAPFGGRERVFGTNPLAWGIPLGDGKAPLVVDFATSKIANGKIDVALSEGRTLPPGVLLSRSGEPTTDPHEFLAGGALLPFGDFKGSGLMLVIELVPTLLTGFAPASSSAFMPGNPTLIMALSVDAFTERERFYQLADELLAHIKNVTPQNGVDEILLPGELETRSFAARSTTGIPVPESVWEKLRELAREFGIGVA